MAFANSLRLAEAQDLDKLRGERPSYEVVAGVIGRKAAPSFAHGDAQLGIGAHLKGPFQFGRGGPGGWWLASEVEIEFEVNEIYLPDLAGWRRDRVPERPSGVPVRVRPDWVCELLSPSTRGRDQTVKRLTYERCRVSHYWIVDLSETPRLHVLRLGPDGYQPIREAGPGDIVRAEPFIEIELDCSVLLGIS